LRLKKMNDTPGSVKPPKAAQEGVEPKEYKWEYFEPSRLLAQLNAEARLGKPDVMPERLPLDSIVLLEDLFQPRATDEKHIQELVANIHKHKVLDPVDVIQVGNKAYLCEGHHRVVAYRLAKTTVPIPVSYFQGSIEEAVLHSRGANSKAKLAMTTNERTNAAWKLVLMGAYTKKQIMVAASVSDSIVASMRRVKNALKYKAYSAKNWRHALHLSKGVEGAGMQEEEKEAWMSVQAHQYADRINKEFGNKLSTNPELAARAFEIYFGRKITDLANELKEHATDEEDEDEGEE
ncbi:ParB N-terminal domain-containing protein, partial [bacterium]|nr:ParB N-terminal domain-containing protein [bacterium]